MSWKGCGTSRATGRTRTSRASRCGAGQASASCTSTPRGPTTGSESTSGVASKALMSESTPRACCACLQHPSCILCVLCMQHLSAARLVAWPATLVHGLADACSRMHAGKHTRGSQMRPPPMSAGQGLYCGDPQDAAGGRPAVRPALHALAVSADQPGAPAPVAQLDSLPPAPVTLEPSQAADLLASPLRVPRVARLIDDRAPLLCQAYHYC